MWCLGAGVLLCRGNRLLTGSNTRWLRLWEVEAVQGVKPQEEVCNGDDRSVAHSLVILVVSYLLCDEYIFPESVYTEEHSGTLEIYSVTINDKVCCLYKCVIMV